MRPTKPYHMMDKTAARRNGRHFSAILTPHAAVPLRHYRTSGPILYVAGQATSEEIRRVEDSVGSTPAGHVYPGRMPEGPVPTKTKSVPPSDMPTFTGTVLSHGHSHVRYSS
jgi:hypothetical protein